MDQTVAFDQSLQRYRVEADSEADAISKLFQGEADPIDNSLEYVEIADDRGMPIDEHRDLADQLFDRGSISGHDEVIPSVRSIEQVE